MSETTPLPESTPEEPPTILEEAQNIIQGPRRESYGDARESFRRIATMWSVIVGKPLTARNVAQMMVVFKVCRDVNKPSKDNAVDMAGYAGLMGDL